MTKEQHTPWYKEPMMLIVAGVPFVAVIWGGVMLSLALDSKDSLVSDSYYKDGISYTEDQSFHRNAVRMNVTTDIVFSENEIRANIWGAIPGKPDHLQLQLIHPTLQEKDLVLFMQRMPDGSYMTANEIELPQKRYIWLSSPEQEWRLKSQEMIEAGKRIQIAAK